MSKLIVATITSFLILGVVAGVAQGSTGDPVIAGKTNISNRATMFEGSRTPQFCDCYGEPTVAIRPISPDRTGLAVDGGMRVTGGLGVAAGNLQLSNASTDIGIGAGEEKAVYKNIFDVTPTSQVIATLQSHRPNLWITAAVPDWHNQTVSVYLNRVIAHPVLLAVAVIED